MGRPVARDQRTGGTRTRANTTHPGQAEEDLNRAGKGDTHSIRLDCLGRDILDLSDRPVSEGNIYEKLKENYAISTIADGLAELLAADLMIRDDQKLLSLVLPSRPSNEGSYRTGVQLPGMLGNVST